MLMTEKAENLLNVSPASLKNAGCAKLALNVMTDMAMFCQERGILPPKVLKPLTNARNHGRSLGHALPRSSMIKAAHSCAPNTLFSLHGACGIKAYMTLERARLAITRLQSCAQSILHLKQHIRPQLTSYAFRGSTFFTHITITVAPGCCGYIRDKAPLAQGQG
eukprot:1156595-Pelagomonas_calceolata.AAC.2